MPKRTLVYLVTFYTEEFLQQGGRPQHPPMGALYIASSLRQSGFEPRIFHLLPSGMPGLERLMESERPALVGFSTLTDHSLVAALKASQRAKLLGIPVIWGGVHASMLPELSLKDAADYVVLGEGEEAFAELATAIVNGGIKEDISGVARITEKGVSFGPAPKSVEDLDRFPPAWDLIDPADYIIPTSVGGALSFIFSRGCPFR